MNFIKNLWTKIRGPVGTNIVAREPAIAAAVGGLGVSIATHYGLHLTAEQQTYITGGAFIALNWIVRQCVLPVTKSGLAQTGGTIRGAEVTVKPPSVEALPPAKKKAPAKRKPAPPKKAAAKR